MDLHKIIGRLFILGFRGTGLSPGNGIIEDIRARNLGGIILFDRFLSGEKADTNIASRSQVKVLCAELQAHADTKLLIGVDQEGGMVRRLKEEHGFPPLPSAEEMGRDKSGNVSALHARRTGEILADSGINCNFAPVADLNSNDKNPIIGKIGRSFSENPMVVAAHCEKWIDGLSRSGVLACMKHFPGHGSSTTDSHKGFVDIGKSWRREELLPYRHLIEKEKVQAIMMGHLFHKDLDARHPASISATVIGDLLRKKMHYEGLVITDDMQMRGITERYGLFEAIVLALSAGADLIVLGNNLEYDADILKKAIHSVEDAVNTGHLSAETLVRAYERVQRVKETLR